MNYKPVKHPKQWQKKVLKDPSMRVEYEVFSLQIELAISLKKARQRAHLTQENVAKQMDTQKSVIARLESAGDEKKTLAFRSNLIKIC